MVDKQGLLDAIAQGGQRAGEAYTAAQNALEAQRTAAVQAALQSNPGLNAEAEAAIAARVSAPYQSYTGALTSGQAISSDYFSKLGANAGTYMDQASALIPALERRYEQELALKMAEAAGSGGGGSGGRGSGGSGDWFDPYEGEFDTKANFYKYLKSQGTDRVPGSIAAQSLARELGVPEGVIMAQFPESEYLKGGREFLTKAKAAGLSVKKFRNKAMSIAAKTKGNQAIERRYLVDQYRGGPPVKRAKRRTKRR